KTSSVNEKSYSDVNSFIGTMKKLTDEQLIEAVKKRAAYNQDAVVAMKIVAMERGLIDEQWKILK
ncbi:MAG: hypothetical protein LBR10_13380, partial [Prevotellaceae bacterium]|nr:hypothetical protein [Prevotellaceae bacterium]